jgi:hypothetical protein
VLHLITNGTRGTKAINYTVKTPAPDGYCQTPVCQVRRTSVVSTANAKLLHSPGKLYQSHDLHRLFNTVAICKTNFIRPRPRVYTQCFEINTHSKNRSRSGEHSNRVNSKPRGAEGGGWEGINAQNPIESRFT